MARCIKEMLIGSDPLRIEELHHELYIGSTMNGRQTFQASCPEAPFFEYLVSDLSRSQLRKNLLQAEASVRKDGTMALPSGPGLGIELDEDTVAKYLLP
jgi:L-alanine-DL-glutamate epimerase-like enolase superfamily enzyme